MSDTSNTYSFGISSPPPALSAEVGGETPELEPPNSVEIVVDTPIPPLLRRNGAQAATSSSSTSVALPSSSDAAGAAAPAAGRGHFAASVVAVGCRAASLPPGASGASPSFCSVAGAPSAGRAASSTTVAITVW